jgi:hypothetical protein
MILSRSRLSGRFSLAFVWVARLPVMTIFAVSMTNGAAPLAEEKMHKNRVIAKALESGNTGKIFFTCAISLNLLAGLAEYARIRILLASVKKITPLQNWDKS